MTKHRPRVYQWSYPKYRREKSPKRCRCSIWRPSADSSRRLRARYSRQPFAEGLEEEESGSSSSAGEPLPKTPSNKSVGKSICFSFSEGPQPCFMQTHKHHESSMQSEVNPEFEKTRYHKLQHFGLQLQRITKFSMKTSNRDCTVDMW